VISARIQAVFCADFAQSCNLLFHTDLFYHSVPKPHNKKRGAAFFFLEAQVFPQQNSAMFIRVL
jgi:hypothetical protein